MGAAEHIQRRANRRTRRHGMPEAANDSQVVESTLVRQLAALTSKLNSLDPAELDSDEQAASASCSSACGRTLPASARVGLSERMRHNHEHIVINSLDHIVRPRAATVVCERVPSASPCQPLHLIQRRKHGAFGTALVRAREAQQGLEQLGQGALATRSRTP
jgi:hypothetical protein